jgi:Domain of unknown function (DUF4149)
MTTDSNTPCNMASPKKRALHYFGRVLQIVSLGFTVGSIIAIGAMVAPTVFYNIDRSAAIGVMSIIFSKLATVLLILTAVYIGGTLLRYLTCESKKQGMTKLCIVRLVLSVLFVAISFCNLFIMTPKMTAMVENKTVASQKAEFDKLHDDSRKMFMAEAGTALLLILVLL